MLTHSLHPLSLLRSLLLERFRWRLLILFLSLVAAVTGVLAVYTQKHFVDALVGGDYGLRWVFASFAFTLVAALMNQLTFWIASRESLISQKALGDFAYGRVLEGPGGLIGRKPAGEAVSLFAVDIPGAASLLDQALLMMSSMVFPLVLAPIAIHYFFGIPSWACGVVILALVLIDLVLARRQSRFFHIYKDRAAQRTGLVSEWVQNIRTLRILGWVEAAEKKIFSLRRRETKNRKSMVTNGQSMNAIASSATFALNLLAILMLLHLRGDGMRPTPGEILSLLWILGVFLARPLRQLPWSLVITMDALSSMRRLEAAFALPIRLPEVVGGGVGAGRGYALEARGLSLAAEDGTALLKEINLALKPGTLVAIVGEVGSGKSLLLQSLIGGTGASFRYFSVGEGPTNPGTPEARRRIAFVPQEGFTMSASLRENVLFTYLRGGQDFSHDDAANRSLRAAQFHPEAERAAAGLDTEIGERGVNLSGGQRQRVALARAHFADRPLILLDDCLSAVDVDTEKRLIESLLCGEWSNRTRLLVTHRLSILPRCDAVIFLENGEIAAEGAYADLWRSSPRFREFVRREEVKRAVEPAEPSPKIPAAESVTDE